jgi:hypothetical protein
MSRPASTKVPSGNPVAGRWEGSFHRARAASRIVPAPRLVGMQVAMCPPSAVRSSSGARSVDEDSPLPHQRFLLLRPPPV